MAMPPYSDPFQYTPGEGVGVNPGEHEGPPQGDDGNDDGTGSNWSSVYTGADPWAIGAQRTFRNPGGTIIGAKDADLIWTESGGGTTLTETTFDTSSKPNAAHILLTNSTGDVVTITGCSIRGKPVMKQYGGEGYIHDSLNDWEDIERNGPIKYEFGNDYIVTLAQLNKLADLFWKLGRGRKHNYTLTLPYTAHEFEIGEWYTIQIGGAGQKEYIDSTCVLITKRYERRGAGIGSTILQFAEVEQNWVLSSNATARFLAAGNTLGTLNEGDVVTVGSSKWTGAASYLCDGTADQTEINLAIADVANLGGGMVQLLGDNFYVTAAIELKSNVIFDGNGATIEKNCNDYAMEAVGASGTELENIVVQNCKFTRNAADTNGISTCYLYYADNLIFEKCVITDPRYIGIRASYCDDITVSSNNLSEVHTQGININYCSGLIVNNNISGISSAGVNVDGIQITNSPKIIFTNNKVSAFDNDGGGTKYGIDVSSCDGAQVANNIFTDIRGDSGVGIAVRNSDNVNVCNNKVEDCYKMLGPNGAGYKDAGIYIDSDCDYTLVTSNYCIDNGNLIDRGNCESGDGGSPEDGDSPMIFGESNPIDGDCTWQRSNAITAYEGDWCYKFTKTNAAGGTAYLAIVDTWNTELHGLVVGKTYKWEGYFYLPSGSSPLGAEVALAFDDDTAAPVTEACANTYDAWQLVELEFTVGAAATQVNLYIRCDSAASQNEYFYVDNVRLYQVGTGNNHDTNYDDDGTDTYAIGNIWQA